MSWRTVVITGNAKLDYKMDYMVIRKSDMTTRIYIGEIGMLTKKTFGQKSFQKRSGNKVYI